MSLEVRGLSFAYGEHSVLEDVSFSLEDGQMLSVLGPNGVGKSTLFHCILGLLTPQAGEILVNGQNIRLLSSRALAQKIAYIPQSHSPTFNFSVLDMVLMGTTAQLSYFSAPGKPQLESAQAVLEQLGISHLAQRGYAHISGGERQLCLIARAMVQQARILILDEPSANLDYGNRIRVMQTLRALAAEGYGVIQSTHDPDQAYLYSDRILALSRGKVLAWGSPRDTISNSLISRLYGVEVEVCSLREDTFRVCVPAAQRANKKGVTLC